MRQKEEKEGLEAQAHKIYLFYFEGFWSTNTKIIYSVRRLFIWEKINVV